MELHKLLTPERIRVPLLAKDKTGAIAELVDVLAESGALCNRDAVLDAVLKREADRTTGIGYGLAIPHGKSDGCERLAMAAGKPGTPIDFASLDGRPVTFVVLLVSAPGETGPHIQALAKISRLMNIEDFRLAVDRARSAEELHRAIAMFETNDLAGRTH